MSRTLTTSTSTTHRRRRSFGSPSASAVRDFGLDDERRKERPRCCLPYLLLYVAVVAVLGSNLRRVVDVDRDDNVDLMRIHSKDAAGGRYGRDKELFFDCSRDGSKCRSFNPGAFFRQYYNTTEATSGNAQSNGTDERYLQWRREIGLENANLPALDSLSWWVERGDDIPGSVQRSWMQSHANNLPPRNVTYIHVHKCGGTSIQGALYRRARRIRDRGSDIPDKHKLIEFHADVRTYKHSFGGGRREKKEHWDKLRAGHVRAIEESQKKGSVASNAFPIFTVVRDPIDRFLSAVQQVMHYNAEFRTKCLREPTESLLSSLVSQHKREENEAKLRKETLRCAIEDMAETQYRRDVHLVPMASHFRLLDALDVSVFEMKDIERVLRYLGDDPTREGSKSNHMRDRSDVKYATSSILARLSPNDCDEEMLQGICKLYRIDVELMRWLGFGGEAVERCKG
ncbi:hypothetical protein ACHAXT_000115 [Thalassiosira profunda]